MLTIIINQILKMLLLLLLGAFCYHKNFIDQRGSEMLANFLLMIINPIVALMALQTEYSPHLVQGLLMSFLLATITHLAAMAVSTLMIRKNGNENYAIEHFSSMYSNCGFIGIPLIQSILGGEGVLYLTAYMIVFNILSWTQGIALMTGKSSLKDLKKGLLSPMIIACGLGLILYFLRIQLPDVLGDSLNYVSSMNTPLAMIIAGVSVAQINLPAMLKKPRLYFISAIKLLIMPALTLFILSFFHINSIVTYTILIAAACPAAATCTAFSLRFHKNYRYSSEIYAFTTICCLITIPLFIFAADHILLAV